MTVENGLLSTRQAKFLEEYLIDRNSRRAAIIAGYSLNGIGPTASRLLRHPVIKAKIGEVEESRIERFGITKDRILQELSQVAFANMKDILDEDEDGNTQVRMKNMSREQASAISELNIEVSKGKTTVKKSKVKLHDKIKALMDLAKMSGHFQEKVEHTGVLTLEQLVEHSLTIDSKSKDIIEGEIVEVNKIEA